MREEKVKIKRNKRGSPVFTRSGNAFHSAGVGIRSVHHLQTYYGVKDDQKMWIIMTSEL